MGAPSDQFLHLLWRPLYVVFFILYGGPSDHFFAYYIEAPRSLSSLTIWGPFRSVSSHTIWESPEISFFAYYMRAPPQISFFAYYMRTPLDRFLCLLFRSPLRSASLLTIRGPLRSFVCILLLHVYGALSNQFLCILCRGPLRSALSLTI